MENKTIGISNLRKVEGIGNKDRREVASNLKSPSDFKLCERVFIASDIEYCGKDYRVVSEGTVEHVGDRQCLVNVDMIDGDANACVFVDNKDMQHCY